MGGLVLDTKEGARKVMVPGKPGDSLILTALRYSDLRLKMPPTGKLSDSVISDFEQWIASGAEDPRPETPSVTSTASPRVIDFKAGRRWWAFQPVPEQAAPLVTPKTWPRNKIHSFILP